MAARTSVSEAGVNVQSSTHLRPLLKILGLFHTRRDQCTPAHIVPHSHTQYPDEHLIKFKQNKWKILHEIVLGSTLQLSLFWASVI